jgi:hypothetical protein
MRAQTVWVRVPGYRHRQVPRGTRVVVKKAWGLGMPSLVQFIKEYHILRQFNKETKWMKLLLLATRLPAAMLQEMLMPFLEVEPPELSYRKLRSAHGALCWQIATQYRREAEKCCKEGSQRRIHIVAKCKVTGYVREWDPLKPYFMTAL